MPKIDYREALSKPNAIDHANVEIQGMTVSRTVKLGLFTTNENAVRAADRILSKESYPYARVKFAANRKLFRLQPGDPFVLKYDKYGIEQMVCRVIFIEEESVECDRIIVSAMEEETRAVKPVDSYAEPTSYRRGRTQEQLAMLSDIAIVESPYLISPNDYKLLFFVPKKTGFELGYTVYMSQDGVDYYRLATKDMYTPYGLLQEEYPYNTASIDDDVGLLPQFDSAQDISLLQTISDIELYGTRNLSLLRGNVLIGGATYTLNEEFVSFRETEAVTSDTYRLTGVLRGALDTSPQTHPIGMKYYFVGNAISPTGHFSFTLGKTVYLKFVPFSSTLTGSIEDATVYTYTFTGRAFKPYSPINLAANGQYFNATYDAENITLTWDARLLDGGAGTGNPSIVIDSSPTWSGRFRVRVVVGTEIVRTSEDINDLTWNYTTVMNLDDNTAYPDKIYFQVSNYITGSQGEEYESNTTTIAVTNSNLITTTTTTSTTTTTV
jgi:hypothetical protein